MMKFDTTDKLIIASTAIIATSATALILSAKKYEKKNRELEFWLATIEDNIKRANGNLLENNRLVIDGNKMLKEILTAQLANKSGDNHA